jgi:hypothetical protein
VLQHALRVRRGCVVLFAACLLAAALACLLGGVGVAQGRLKPIWFDHSLGAAHLVGYNTWNASCVPYTGCAPTRREAYVVWVVWRPGEPRSPALRLLSLPIIHDASGAPPN